MINKKTVKYFRPFVYVFPARVRASIDVIMLIIESFILKIMSVVYLIMGGELSFKLENNEKICFNRDAITYAYLYIYDKRPSQKTLISQMPQQGKNSLSMGRGRSLTVESAAPAPFLL